MQWVPWLFLADGYQPHPRRKSHGKKRKERKCLKMEESGSAMSSATFFGGWVRKRKKGKGKSKTKVNKKKNL